MIVAQRSAAAWDAFYEALEENVRIVEDILAAGGPLESIYWTVVKPPAGTLPASYRPRHQRLMQRLARVSEDTNNSLQVVRKTLHDLPRHGHGYTESAQRGISLDVFG